MRSSLMLLVRQRSPPATPEPLPAAFSRLVYAGHPALWRESAPVSDSEFNSRRFKQLVEDMRTIMQHEDTSPAGLAAPQLGESLQVIAIQFKQEWIEQGDNKGAVELPLQFLVNPKIKLIGSERVNFFEGCLSIPGYVALVPRARSIEVIARDLNNKQIGITVANWTARIIQHEVDHLHGVMITDRMLNRSFRTEDNVNQPLPTNLGQKL